MTKEQLTDLTKEIDELRYSLFDNLEGIGGECFEYLSYILDRLTDIKNHLWEYEDGRDNNNAV